MSADDDHEEEVATCLDGRVPLGKVARVGTEDSADAWIAVRIERDRRLTANSWSCFYCELDAETGRITAATFTK